MIAGAFAAGFRTIPSGDPDAAAGRKALESEQIQGRPGTTKGSLRATLVVEEG
jgi:hypothetical protein